MTEEGENQIEEGLSCVAELVFNQSQVSQRMWNIFGHMTHNFMQDKGCIGEYIQQAAEPIINYMNKAPTEFMTMKLGEQTPLDITLSMI